MPYACLHSGYHGTWLGYLPQWIGMGLNQKWIDSNKSIIVVSMQRRRWRRVIGLQFAARTALTSVFDEYSSRRRKMSIIKWFTDATGRIVTSMWSAVANTSTSHIRATMLIIHFPYKLFSVSREKFVSDIWIKCIRGRWRCIGAMPLTRSYTALRCI